MLPLEEYVEQGHFFRTLGERLPENVTIQELLEQVRHELLSTTRLPMAIDFMLAEIRHAGTMSTAMARLPHYFTPFQTYVIREAEAERGRFDMRIAVEILRHEAEYRSKGGTAQGIFVYQFECVSRNRLKYDPGLGAMADDSIFDANWKEWILTVRRQIGLVDFADMIFVRSQYYQTRRTPRGGPEPPPEAPILFGEKEGMIAWANRRKDPLYLFAALQRHLGYPIVPRPKKPDETQNLLPLLTQRLERLETRIKLLEEEGRSGLDITKFYGEGKILPNVPPPDDSGRQ
ncbi:MAG TPA: hypothetical protein VFB96_07920 [Pirellulaceae bacterium]|nr:hypothetical protein [Pirellulaceae bacterium]